MRRPHARAAENRKGGGGGREGNGERDRGAVNKELPQCQSCHGCKATGFRKAHASFVILLRKLSGARQGEGGLLALRTSTSAPASIGPANYLLQPRLQQPSRCPLKMGRRGRVGALSIPGAGCLPWRGGRALPACGYRKPRKAGSGRSRAALAGDGSFPRRQLSPLWVLRPFSTLPLPPQPSGHVGALEQRRPRAKLGWGCSGRVGPYPPLSSAHCLLSMQPPPSPRVLLSGRPGFPGRLPSCAH